MASVYLDLRVQGVVPIYVTKTISYPAITFTFAGGTMPTGFTIVMKDFASNGDDVTFAIGSGLTLSGANMLVWSLPTITQNAGVYHGTLMSTELVYGTAVRANITITVSL
jgi:hypothetical protein